MPGQCLACHAPFPASGPAASAPLHWGCMPWVLIKPAMPKSRSELSSPSFLTQAHRDAHFGESGGETNQWDAFWSRSLWTIQKAHPVGGMQCVGAGEKGLFSHTYMGKPSPLSADSFNKSVWEFFHGQLNEGWADSHLFKSPSIVFRKRKSGAINQSGNSKGWKRVHKTTS